MGFLFGRLVKFQFAMFFILTFLFLSTISLAADGVNISVEKKDIMMYSNDETAVEVLVQNNQIFKDRFIVSIFYIQSPGITIISDKNSIDVNPSAVSNFKVNFYSSACVQELRTLVTVTVKSATHEDVEDSKVITLNTIRNSTVCIYDAKMDKYVVKPQETFKITATLKNPTDIYSMPVFVETKIMKENSVIQSFEDRIETVPAGSIEQIEHSYNFSKYTSAGFYRIEILLKDSSGNTIDTKKIDFRTSELPENVVKHEEVSWGLFTQTVAIKVRNEGNVESSSFYLTATIPSFMSPFFSPKVTPSGQETVGTNIVYSWYMEGLKPGEENEIKYEVSTWNALIIILVLIGVVLYSFKYIYKISVVKKHRYSGPLTKDKEIVISLDVRNRTRHPIKDVFVRDFVPSIVTIVERFDTVKPMIRKVSGGSEIIWKFDTLAPLEDRVVSYRVKPKLDIVGSLRLPRASVSYSDKNKQLKKTISKNIRIRAR